MSKPRRSLIRSSLQRIRQLWHRRESGRREMRRCLGSTFEQLEQRLTFTISADLPPIFPAANSHIHPTLTILLDGQQVVIPAGIGINGSAFANPHTHDYTGTLHVGEGATAGTDSSGSGARNVTLQDFFNVWSSNTLTGAAALNTNARLDTDATDGTASPRIMDKTVDSTHVLRMYVKEAGDSAPELEYASNSSSNSIPHPELYIPRDGDQIIVSYDKLTQAVDSPSFDTITSQNVLGGAPTWLGINGIDPTGGPLTYTVSVANPSLITASIPTGNKSLVLNTSSSALEGGFGQMTFQLFDNLAPRTTQHIETLVNNGEFATSSTFYRIAYSGNTPFVIQGGPSNSTSSLGKFDDEFNTDLQFTSTGMLAMAKSTDDTNDSQIFVTAGPTRFLDMQHSIFGILTQGNDVRQAIQSSRTSGDGAPPNTITITSAQIITDTQNAALELKAAEGASGQTDVTVTVQDQQGHTYSQTFHVTVSPDTANSAPFLNPITPPVGVSGQPITVQLTAQDAENLASDPNFFDASKPSSETANIIFNETQQITRNADGNVTFSFNGANATQLSLSASTTAAALQTNLSTIPALNGKVTVTGSTGGPFTVKFDNSLGDVAQIAVNNGNASVTTLANANASVNHQTGLVTITPPAGFVGTFHVSMGVRGTQTTTTADAFDTQDVLVTVNPSAPSAIDLVTASDSGSSSTDNITNAASLDFTVSGLTIGATVKLLKGSTVLAQGVATSSTITLTVANPGTALGQGASDLTATQTVSGETSPASTALKVTYDTGVPNFTSTAPTTALVGFNLNYDAQTNEEGGTTGLTYSLTNAPSGATINSTTGVVTWSPTSAQAGAQAFSIVATDAAGNSATHPVNLTVNTTIVDLTLTLTTPAGAPLTSLSIGQDFVLHLFAQDLRTTANGVFAAYLDILYDGTKATATGPITYTDTYSSGQSGDATTDGVINEAGSFAGSAQLGPTKREVLSIPLKAKAAGTLTFNGDPADTIPAHNVLVYGQDGQVPQSQVHYGTASIEVGSTFNAVNDSFNVNEDTSNTTFNPLANDTNTGSNTNTLTISAVTQGNHGGTITISSDNKTVKYTPAANFVGQETFTYTAKNQSNETHTATVTMTVADVNDAPVATNDSFSATKNTTANSFNVLANDTTGVDTGETLRVSAVGAGSQGGTITIASDGKSVLYTPKANFSGNETFTYTISDRAAGASGGLTSTATVTVNVSGLTATNDSGTGFTFNEDSGAQTLDVLANDALDPQVGGTLSITAVGTTDHGGTVSITQNSTRLSYTPAANFQGTEKFTYTITDGQGHNATATVTMTINNLNDAPVATNDTLTAFKDTTANFDVLSNDNSGPDPTETLTIDSIATQPQHGTASIVSGKVQYVPSAGYTGPDSFTYTIKDPGGLTSTATANITVQDFQPSKLSGFVYFDVNNNGVFDLGELPIAGVTITLTGTATAGSTTNVNQTTKTGEDGSYKFENLAPGTYQLKETQPQFLIDGKETAGSQGGTATTNQIAITNMAQNTTGINNNFGELGRQLTTISIRDFFSSTSRNYAHAAFDSSGAELWHTVTGSVWQGTTNAFTLQSSQSQIKYDSTNSLSQTTSVTVATDLPVYLSGQASGNKLYYIPHDMNGGGGNNGGGTAPVGVADTYSTPVSTALTIPVASGVLKNDTVAAGKTLTASLVAQPSHGTVSLNADGSFTYTPTTGFTGQDTFTYKASDGTNQSSVTTVTISVGSGPPTAVADSFAATEDTPLSITAANGVLKNDVDPTNHTLTASIVTQPTKGTVTLASDGSFTYTPNANANGTDTFTYKANNTTNDSNVATATITIAAVNDAPVAVNDSFTATKDTPLNVTTSPNLLSNDTDVDNSSLTILTTPVTNPTNGTVVLNNNGNFTYTPNTGFTGTDTFQYQVSDGTLTATGTVTITVNAPGNHAPVSFGDLYNFDEDVGGTVSVENGVLANDTDSDTGTTLTAINATQPAHGTVVMSTNGSFTYTPNANYFGPDSFTYQASDGTANSTAAVVSITVHPTNDAPAGVADSYRVVPNTLLTVTAANGVLKNDTDIDSSNLTATVLFTTTHGQLNLAADGSFTYMPNSSFTGTDSFTYKVSDDANPHGESGSIQVDLIVNSAPVAHDDPYSTNEDTVLTITGLGVLLNDGDPNSDPLTAGVIAQPTHGTLDFHSNGTFTYTPNADFVGTDTFRYQATDGIAASGPATVTITINAVNDAPVRTAGSTNTVSVEPDSNNTTAVSLGLSALTYGPGGGADEVGQNLTIKLTGIPSAVHLFLADGTTAVAANQTLTLAELQGLKYKTVAEAIGGGNITWTVQDDGGTTNGGVDTLSEHLTITVGVNDQPVRTAGAITPITVDEDSTNTTAATLGLTGLTYGPGGGATEASQVLVIKVATIPSFVSVFKADGTTAVSVGNTLTLAELVGLKFKTIADANGTGSLTWTVQDDGGTLNGGIDTLTETLAITVNAVNDAPVRTSAAAAPPSVAEDVANSTAVPVGLSGLTYTVGDGSFESSQTLSIQITGVPSFISLFKADGTTAVTAGSTLSLAELQGLKFKTIANANGTANITYNVVDNGGTAHGGVDTLAQTLSFTVNAVNDSPLLTAGTVPSLNVSEDASTSTAVSLGLSGVTYGPGDGSNEANQTLTYKITAIPTVVALFKADGTTAVNVNDTLTLAELQGLKYKTVAEANGAGSITFSVKDSGGTATGGVDTLNQTLTVNVSAVNDKPARTAGSVPDFRVPADVANTTAVSLLLSGLTYGPGGGNDEANQTLTFKITNIPSFAPLFLADGTTSVTVNQSLTLAQLRGLTYKTIAGQVGAGVYTWTVQDNGGTANGGVDILTENQVITVGVNDPPARTAGNPTAISVAEDSTNTTAVTLGLTGLNYGAGAGDEASQTLTFTVTAIPAYMNVFKADGTTAVAANSTLTLNELQNLTFKTVPNANGTGNLTWTVKDNGGTANGGNDTLTETLSVTVSAINDAPTRTAGSPSPVNELEDSANTTAVTLGFAGLSYGVGGGSDEVAQTLTYKVASIPSFITLFKADGTTAVTTSTVLTLTELQGLKYKTVANAVGTGNLTWTVQDTGGTASGGVDTLTETIAVAINAVNDAPVLTSAAPSSITVNEDSATSIAATLGFSSLTYGPGGGSDESAQTLTYQVTSIPSSIHIFKADGTSQVAVNDPLTLAEFQGLKYKTVANANGAGQLNWTVKDSGGTAGGGADTLTQTLAITVSAINDAPSRTAGTTTAITVDEDSANSTAAELGLTSLTYGPGGGTDEGTQALTYKVTAIPSFVHVFLTDGTTQVNSGDALSLTDLKALKYKTLANANGTGQITWSVKDDGLTANGGVDTLTETLAITVTSLNDKPVRTTGTINPITVDEDDFNDTATPLGLTGFAYGPGGGADEDSQALTFKITAIPDFVHVFLTDGTTQVDAGDTLSLTELQELTYKTIPDANGSGQITWIVKDDGGTANGGVDSLTENLTITVTAVNDAPHGDPDFYDIAQGGTLTADADHSVLNNDTDVEGDSFIGVKVTDPANGNLTFNDDGTFTYTPNPIFHGSDSFTYQPKDAALGNVVTVVIAVHAPPVAHADTYMLTQAGQLVTTLANGTQFNDENPDSRPLTSKLVDNVDHGSLTLNDDGTFTYSPDPLFAGDDSFTYFLTDDTVDSNTVTVTLHVQATGQNPEATDLALLLLMGGEGESWNSLLDDSGNYQDAVDHLMGQLG